MLADAPVLITMPPGSPKRGARIRGGGLLVGGSIDGVGAGGDGVGSLGGSVDGSGEGSGTGDGFAGGAGGPIGGAGSSPMPCAPARGAINRIAHARSSIPLLMRRDSPQIVVRVNASNDHTGKSH